MGRLRSLALLTAAALAGSLLPGVVSAQEDQLQLGMRRTFGYAWRDDVQGSFLLVATGPGDLEQVVFYVDEYVLETVTAPPFEARLHTGDFPQGQHRLWAEGQRGDGSTIQSNVIPVEFVSAEGAWQSAAGMLTPVLIVLGVAMAVGVGLTALSSRRYRPGAYGSSGGAVCPRCTLPMPRHFLSPNMGTRKLERCPHCGKWSLVARASATMLASGEARLRGEASPEPTDEQTEETIRRKIEDSRFVD